jgi:hypothetical protein
VFAVVDTPTVATNMEIEPKVIYTETHAATGLILILGLAVLAALVGIGTSFVDGQAAGKKKKDN